MRFTVAKLVAVLILGLFAPPLAAETQQTGKAYRIAL